MGGLMFCSVTLRLSIFGMARFAKALS
jgi:hypothetical protein